MIELTLNWIGSSIPYFICIIIITQLFYIRKEAIKIREYAALTSYSTYNIQKNTFRKK